MPFKLTSVGGEHEQTFDLPVGSTVVVGRALTSDIPVFDPTISRRHAELVAGDEGVEVRDLGSSNGTYLNGGRIETARLASGDVISFGKVPFKVTQLTPSLEHVVPPTPPALATPPKGATIVRQLPATDGAVLGITHPTGSDEQRSAKKLALLLEVSKGLTRTVDTGALLDTIAGFCLQIFDVDYVSILLDNVPKVSRDRHGTAAQRTVPQSIVRTAVQDKVGILSDNAPEDMRFGGQSILMQRVRSTMCAPLVGSE
jgi:adenylate cyclase